MFLIWSRSPTTNNVRECPSHHVGVRVIWQENAITDIVLFAIPELTILVVGAHYDVTIFGQAHRFRAIDTGGDIFVSSLSHRCRPREVGRSNICDCKIHRLDVAFIIITFVAQVRDCCSRSLLTDASD